MILSIHIRNIALIEDLTIDFDSGMHTLTGETGAGKSIIVDAVNLVLGGRSDRDIVRHGADKAAVEALFDISDTPAAADWLRAHEIEPEENTAAIYREISAAGRTVSRICGVTMQAAALRDFASLLIDVHGQHEHRFLMDPKYHLHYLDASGGEEHGRLMRETEQACEAFTECHRQLRRLVKSNEQKQYRLEQIKKSLDELEKAALKEGEEEALTAERERSRHAGKIADAIRAAYSQIAAGDMEPALSKLKPAMDALKSIAEFGEPFSSMASRVETVYYETEELGYELADILEKGEFDPNRAEFVENRLELIHRLERKYGSTIHEVLTEQEKLREEYDNWLSLDHQLETMMAEDRKLLAAYRQAARELSASRHRLALKFDSQMQEQLKDLGMERTRFCTMFAELPQDHKPLMPSPEGDDTLEFMISPNPGEPLKSLSKIASGGELSRLMLALKTLEADRGGVGCMIFDEIDTGISGKAAQVVAEKMALIARHRQVLCVTHLPQIASMADTQFLVEKKTAAENGREVTRTYVRKLQADERKTEIARMLGGATGSDESALAHAARMLEAAAKSKTAREN